MSSLKHEPCISDPDGFYQELIDAVQRLSPDDALAFSARLNLLLANHIGDRTVLREAIEAARKGLENRK
ncbi:MULTISPECIES: DUF2783 domain-containing protein [unclassified Minwuia]|uniref:DUF2783 domain-containing protein n=1 Tax=unclassified Minwuia TaxID=2618799 RepID=UPI00247A9426|nr:MULTISPECIES: DUF2783 domain-containing protein [unclassified Minwuia]